MAGTQEAAVKNRTLIYLGSATVAECVEKFLFVFDKAILTNNNDFDFFSGSSLIFY